MVYLVVKKLMFILFLTTTLNLMNIIIYTMNLIIDGRVSIEQEAIDFSKWPSV